MVLFVKGQKNCPKMIIKSNQQQSQSQDFYPIRFQLFKQQYQYKGNYKAYKHKELFVLKNRYIMGKKQNDDKPAPPKRALSAFFLYREEVYSKVKSENPDAKITELTKIISEMWKNIDAAHKARLEARYQENKEKVALQKTAYVDKYGKIEKKKKKKHNKKD